MVLSDEKTNRSWARQSMWLVIERIEQDSLNQNDERIMLANNREVKQCLP